MALKETIQEFKEFAIKGNVVDMAVGVIIGGAFGKIVTSFVNDLIMPIIGKLTGGADFSQLYLPLDGNHYATLADAQAATATIAYGSFLTQVLDFLIVAIVIFATLKVLVKLKRPAAPVEEAPTTKVCPFCKSEIAMEATRCPHCTSSGGLISKTKAKSSFLQGFRFLFYLFLFFASAFLRGKNLFYLPEAVRGQSPVLYNPAPSTFRRRCKAHDRKPIRSTPCGRHATGKTQDIPWKFPRRQELMPPLLPSFFGQPFILDILIILLFGIPFSTEAGIARIQMPFRSFCVPHILLGLQIPFCPQLKAMLHAIVIKSSHPLYRLIHHPIKLIGTHVKSLLRRVNAFAASGQGFIYQAFQTHRRQIGVCAFLRQVKGFIVKVAAVIGSTDNKNNAHQSQKRFYHAILSPVCIFIGDITILDPFLFPPQLAYLPIAACKSNQSSWPKRISVQSKAYLRSAPPFPC